MLHIKLHENLDVYVGRFVCTEGKKHLWKLKFVLIQLSLICDAMKEVIKILEK